MTVNKIYELCFFAYQGDEWIMVLIPEDCLRLVSSQYCGERQSGRSLLKERG